MNASSVGPFYYPGVGLFWSPDFGTEAVGLSGYSVNFILNLRAVWGRDAAVPGPPVSLWERDHAPAHLQLGETKTSYLSKTNYTRINATPLRRVDTITLRGSKFLV